MEEVAKQPVPSGKNARCGAAGSGPQQLLLLDASGPAGRRWRGRGGPGEEETVARGRPHRLFDELMTRAKASYGPVWPSVCVCLSPMLCSLYPLPGSIVAL